ncbi:membrane-associated progesterone receptor component [Entomortierella parvispora]|uniref:Membrane-associated progesterone receptor component n=1 Tax=Entomortierella parvispora TaxID=205924 RepID=A0A9P3HK61_9FUNG|nr:membrane-associated progesterone receptor component [Entomortierella parvispora]
MDSNNSIKQRKNGARQGQEPSSLKGQAFNKTDAVKKSTSSSSAWSSVLQGFLLFVVFLFLASYLITDTWFWGYKGKYLNYHHWVPRKQLVFTQQELAQYDGTDPTKNIYLAVKGEVFDVTAGRPYYAKGGGYGFFSGRDASRAYSTGCFQTHLTHDLRGLTKDQLGAVDGWANFYRNHPKYFKVGTVILDPIDPHSPIPEDCNKPVAAKPSS